MQKSISKKVVISFVFLNYDEMEAVKSPALDGVLDYAKETLILSQIYAEFDKAVREGDGIQIIHCWRFPFLLFKAFNSKKNTQFKLQLSWHNIAFSSRQGKLNNALGHVLLSIETSLEVTNLVIWKWSI